MVGTACRNLITKGPSTSANASTSSMTGGAFAGGRARLLDVFRPDHDPCLRRQVDGVQADARIGDLPCQLPQRARLVLDVEHQGVLLAGDASARALQRLARL